MDKEALRQRLMVTFLGELEEHVQSLNRDLLALEKEPGAELLTSLFRTAHSLKGAARSVNVQLIETACHRLESLLGGARDGRRSLDADTIQLLFTTADALKDAGSRLRARQDLSDAPLHALLPTLDDANRRTDARRGAVSSPAPAMTSIPESSPPSVREGFVRVQPEKLDRLLESSGELLVARRRTTAGHEMLSLLRDDMRQWRSEWLQLERPLRKVLTSHSRLLPKRATVVFDQTRERLKTLEHRVELLSARIAAEAHGLERAAASLEDEIRRVQMFPFSQACEGLERTVRDLAHGSSKQVELAIEGGDVELGRFVLESLKDPLRHLVRNAVDHGVEMRDERQAVGKPVRATITVAAALRGGGVEIVVADDGRGLDMAAIAELARRKKMAVPEDDRDAARLIFLPGFSTVRLITELSGRGVGLDIVKHRVESLHGEVGLTFEPGRGTRVVLTVPVTLATIRALLLGVAGQVFAIPVTSVRRLTRVGAADLASTGGREVLLSNGAPVPVVLLSDILGIQGAPPHSSGRRAPVVIVASGNTQLALVVDELIAEEEVLVKSLGSRLRRVRHFAGATILPSGRVALILNTADVVHTALGRAPRRALAAALADSRPEAKRRLLVVDDSVTTRSLERSILEGAGYEVMVAVDGSEAWRLLQDAGADLVVADVEMPRMDGFALCEAIRGSKRFRELPVVLVTALESDADKKRGLDVGADAYLPKSAFDQRQLLETIAQLL
jgi:two-component system chemotaxis sensor kinase CheA